MNEFLRDDILVEDSTCVVSYNHWAVQGPRAATTGLQRKTVLSVKRV